MVLATPQEVDAVIAHVKAYRNGDPHGATTDLRVKIRAVEEVMLTTHAAALVGNQAMVRCRFADAVRTRAAALVRGINDRQRDGAYAHADVRGSAVTSQTPEGLSQARWRDRD